MASIHKLNQKINTIGAVISYLDDLRGIVIGALLIPLIVQNEWLSKVVGLVAAYLGGFNLTYYF